MLDKQILDIPVQYGHSISIHVMENSQLSAWLNKCYFPCLPSLHFFIAHGNEHVCNMCVVETIFLKNFCCQRIQTFIIQKLFV